jgi:regulatory protein
MYQAPSEDDSGKQLKKAIGVSCRILAIREHSIKQLTQKLATKGFEPKVIRKALEWLQQENWLSEERFCGSFIRGKVAKGQGLLRIESELGRQKICSSIIERCIQEENIDWQSICEAVAQKKLKILLPSTKELSFFEGISKLDWQQLNTIKLKLERFLRYRGFTNDEITTTLRQCFAKQESI